MDTNDSLPNLIFPLLKEEAYSCQCYSIEAVTEGYLKVKCMQVQVSIVTVIGWHVSTSRVCISLYLFHACTLAPVIVVPSCQVGEPKHL